MTEEWRLGSALVEMESDLLRRKHLARFSCDEVCMLLEEVRLAEMRGRHGTEKLRCEGGGDCLAGRLSVMESLCGSSTLVSMVPRLACSQVPHWALSPRAPQMGFDSLELCGFRLSRVPSARCTLPSAPAPCRPNSLASLPP